MKKEAVVIVPGMKICFNPKYAECHGLILGLMDGDNAVRIEKDYKSSVYADNWLYLEVIETKHLPDVKKLVMICKTYEEGKYKDQEMVIIYPEDFDIALAFDYKPIQ